MKRIFILAFAVVFPLFLAGQPRLEHRSNSTARIVANGKPMLMIGGELGNSSASTPEDVKRTFSHLSKIGLNTVLAPVSWELIDAFTKRRINRSDRIVFRSTGGCQKATSEDGDQHP